MSLVSKTLSSGNALNYTNIALMLISTVLAFILPFQLFLFSYAVLGPLHYLTEISWLDKRNFFTEKKQDVWLYVLMAALMTWQVIDEKSGLNKYTTTFIVTAFFYTIIIFFIKNNTAKYFLTIIVFLISTQLKNNSIEFFIIWFLIMLPTIIHVFVFTGLFILYGALKSKSTTGIISLIVFIICACSFYVYTPSVTTQMAGEYIQKAMQFLSIINKALLYIFNMDGVDSLQTMVNYPNESLFTHPAAIVVARFVAFAYTYHYLNWFSKTTVIKWHEVSKLRLLLISLLWVASVSIYYLDFTIGFKVLFLLSILHVFFEFPLNLQTIKGIGTEIGRRISS